MLFLTQISPSDNKVLTYFLTYLNNEKVWNKQLNFFYASTEKKYCKK